jgi:hypothetical protein
MRRLMVELSGIVVRRLKLVVIDACVDVLC